MNETESHDMHNDSKSAKLRVKSQRHLEMQDWLNRNIYHPLALRLAQKLYTTKVTPNMVSVFSGLMVVMATYLYTLPHWPYTVILGLTFHMSWHIIDGADGDLARLRETASPTGEIIDGLSDYTSHIILYCVLAYYLSIEIGSTLAWTAAVGAGISRILQANHYEVCRRQYQWWTYEQPWIGQKPLHSKKILERMAMVIANLYLYIAKYYKKSNYNIDTDIIKIRDNIEARQNIVIITRQYLLPYIKSISILSANYRTIILGISMLLGSPLWYFLYEIALLNIIFIYSIKRHKTAMHNFSKAITAQAHQ